MHLSVQSSRKFIPNKERYKVMHISMQCPLAADLRLYIIYFKWYDAYHDTHEAKNMYQWYILSGFRPKKLDRSTNFTGIWEF